MNFFSTLIPFTIVLRRYMQIPAEASDMHPLQHYTEPPSRISYVPVGGVTYRIATLFRNGATRYNSNMT